MRTSACRKIDGYIYAGTSGESDDCLSGKKTRKNQKTATFKVIGNSMAGDNIYSGDKVVVKLCNFALPGMICAIQTPYGKCLKRFEPLPNGEVFLHSSNPDFKTQWWDGVDLTIIGIVQAIRR